jgi:hypothetical protein
MLSQQLAFCAFLAASTVAFAGEVFLPVAGSAGFFRSDVRIFNPSQTKDIQVRAYYLSSGNINNSNVQSITITIPRRQMAIYNDVVSSLFHASGLGGIRLTSSDVFIATERVYATSTTACTGAVNPCTLGQFVNGIDSASALMSGILLQLSAPTGFASASRTNIGAVNTVNDVNSVTWRVYDRNNALVGAPKQVQMPPYAVMAPGDIRSFGANIPAAADLSDAWVSFVADHPIAAYASVVDNGSTDQTCVPAIADTDPPTSTVPPALNFTGTFSGRSCPGSSQCEIGTSFNSTLNLTQTGNTISGNGSIFYEVLQPAAAVLVTGSVSGTTLTLKLSDNGGGCPRQFDHVVTASTLDSISGTYVKRGGCNVTTVSGTFALIRKTVTGPAVLVNGQAVSNIAVGTGGSVAYTIRLPADRSNLTVVTSGGTGDVDLYLKRGAQPTPTSYDYRSNGPDTNENVSVSANIYDLEDVLAGDWYITVYGYSASTGIVLKATYY